jgi:RimJ/RimL family protein N-acetyltransferase
MKEVTLIGLESAEAYAEHLCRHMSESGIDNIIYTPYRRHHPHSAQNFLEQMLPRMQSDLLTPHWERVFVAKIEGKIVGHLDLRGPAHDTGLHRCRLGMGLDPEARGQGLGSELLRKAISWVKSETQIDWIDLYTFSHNHPAISLYKKFGFRQVGLIEDLFRIDGESISDYSMALKIER